MKRLAFFAALIVAGCGHGDQIAYLGRWHGDFVVDEITGGGTDKDRQREGLHGSLQVYETHQSCKLHLQGEQETIDADGFWSLEKGAMMLKFTKIAIDDNGGYEHRDPNLKFIPPTDITASYQRSLVLHLSKDKQKLNGLEISIGHLVGHYLFTRSTD